MFGQRNFNMLSFILCITSTFHIPLSPNERGPCQTKSNCGGGHPELVINCISKELLVFQVSFLVKDLSFKN